MKADKAGRNGFRERPRRLRHSNLFALLAFISFYPRKSASKSLASPDIIAAPHEVPR